MLILYESQFRQVAVTDSAESVLRKIFRGLCMLSNMLGHSLQRVGCWGYVSNVQLENVSIACRKARVQKSTLFSFQQQNVNLYIEHSRHIIYKFSTSKALINRMKFLNKNLAMRPPSCVMSLSSTLPGNRVFSRWELQSIPRSSDHAHSSDWTVLYAMTYSLYNTRNQLFYFYLDYSKFTAW